MPLCNGAYILCGGRWQKKHLDVFDHQIHRKVATDVIGLSFDAQWYDVFGYWHGKSVGCVILKLLPLPLRAILWCTGAVSSTIFVIKTNYYSSFDRNIFKLIRLRHQNSAFKFCEYRDGEKKERKQQINSNFLSRQSVDLKFKIRFIRICTHIALKSCGPIVC